MKQIILRVVKFLIYASFFVPILAIPSSFIFPFIVPKIVVFRSIVTLMIGGYVLLLITNWNEFKPKFNWVNLAVSAFFLSFALSTFIGVDSYHSFWDNHERMLGLFTIFHYLAYFFICGAVLKTWADWKWALRVFLLAGSIVMFIGVLQKWVNPDLLLNQGSDRVASTLGNSIYVGGYGLFLAFASFLLFIRDKNNIWKWVYGATGLLAILGMFFSGTRGSMLGFLVGIGVLIVGYAITLKEQPKTKKVLWIVAAGCLLLLGVMYAYRKTEFVQNIPAIGRTMGTSLSDVKNSARWIAWTIAYESWKEMPVFGWGPNNFFYAFNQHYNPRSLEFGYGETWFDNAHNIIMNTLAVQGIVGLLSYLSIFIFAIWSMIIAFRRGASNPHLLVVGSAFLLAHLTQSVTVFENITSYLYFYFWLAMISRLSTVAPQPAVAAAQKTPETKIQQPVITPDKPVSMGLVATVGLVCFLTLFIFNIQPARANMKTLAALRTLSYTPAVAIEEVKAALSFGSPHIDDIRSDLARTSGQVLASAANMPDKEKAKELFNLVYPALKSNLTLHPLDIRNQLTLFTLSQEGYQLYQDPRYVYEGGTFLEDALKKSPGRQQIMYNLANFYLQTNKWPESVKLLEQALEENPKISESYWRLAYVYKVTGNMNKAKEILDLAQKNGIIFTEQEQGIVAQIVPPAPTTTSKTVPTKKK
jgi:O-antigen ligase